MIRKFRAVVQTTTEPEDKHVIWLKNNMFLYYENGAWVPVDTITLVSIVMWIQELMNNLNTQVDTNANDIAQLNNYIDALNNSINNLQSNINGLQSDLSVNYQQHTQILAQLNNYIATNDIRVNDLINQLLDLINNQGSSTPGSGDSQSSIGSLIVETTYQDLCDLVTNEELVPGMLYRITDYVCTTIQEDTQATNHRFDIIVRALTTTTLDPKAKAAKHVFTESELNTVDPNEVTYFDNCDLSKWELKYSLENDMTKFAWADDIDGKGVIYYMKDEFGNECPYDFKNIQFKRVFASGIEAPIVYNSHFTSVSISQILVNILAAAYPGGFVAHPDDDIFIVANNGPYIKWCYTFCEYSNLSTIEDSSVCTTKSNNNIVNPIFIDAIAGGVFTPIGVIQMLNDVVMFTTIGNITGTEVITGVIKDVEIGHNSSYITVYPNCSDCKIGHHTTYCTLGRGSDTVNIGNYGIGIALLHNNRNINIGDYSEQVIIGDSNIDINIGSYVEDTVVLANSNGVVIEQKCKTICANSIGNVTVHPRVETLDLNDYRTVITNNYWTYIVKGPTTTIIYE